MSNNRKNIRIGLLIFFAILILLFNSNCNNGPTTPEVQPEIWISISNLLFSASVNGENPASQELEVKNSGQGTLNYSIAEDADWIEVSPTSGTSTGEKKIHNVSVKKSGLTEGNYTATITVTDSNATNSPLKVNVTFDLKGPLPKIHVTPSSLSFTATAGGANPASQKLKVMNSGQGTLNYTITNNATWLKVSPKKGTCTGEKNIHTISVQIKGMTEGNYSANITITDPNAVNTPQTVSVTLKLKKPLPKIHVTPSSLSFTAAAGGANPPAKELKIKNSGQGTLKYTITDDADWLKVSPRNGTSTGEENIHNVSVRISGMTEGNYSATITITDPNAINSPQTVNVSLELKKQLPKIHVKPSSLSFTATAGGANPAAKELKVKNSGQGTLKYTITDDADWSEVSPKSGTSAGEEKTHKVSVNIGGKTEGNYSATVTITDPNAINSPQTVSVSLELKKAAPPKLCVSPGSLSFEGTVGDPPPPSKQIKIWNCGEGGILVYTIKVIISGSWQLFVAPLSGTSNVMEYKFHDVWVETTGLSAGIYTAKIKVEDPNALDSPREVNVTLLMKN